MAWHGFHFFWWAFQRLLLISIWESFAYLWTSSNIQAFVFFSSVCPLWKDVLWDNQGSWFGFLFCQWGPALVKELLQTTNHHKSLHLGQTSISSSLNPPPAKSIFWSTRIFGKEKMHWRRRSGFYSSRKLHKRAQIKQKLHSWMPSCYPILLNGQRRNLIWLMKFAD